MFKKLIYFCLLLVIFISFPSITYAATCEWTGVVNNQWGTVGNWSGCTTPSNGDTLQFNDGASNTTMNNDLSGLSNMAVFFFGGTYTLNGNSLNLTGLANSGSETTTINVILTGGPSSIAQYDGKLILNANNTYSGTNSVIGGALFINGSQPNSNVTVDGSNSSLNGIGTSCCVTLQNGGKFLPGNLGPGIYTINGSFTDSNTSDQVLIDLAGQNVGSGYDQIIINNNAILNGTLIINNTFTPAVGSQFVIINMSGEGTITGSFSNAPEGSTITSNNSTFRITYTGGDGDDVVLTTLTSNTPQGGNSFSNSSPTGSPICTTLSTNLIPELFQVDYTDTSAILYINPKTNSYDSAQVIYGFNPYEERYGGLFKNLNNLLWIQKLNINNLAPNTTYHFFAKTMSGCSASKNSNSLKITTSPKGNITKKQVFLYN